MRVEKCLRVRGCYDGRSIKHDMLGRELRLDAGRSGLGLISFFFFFDRQESRPRECGTTFGLMCGKVKKQTLGRNLYADRFLSLPLPPSSSPSSSATAEWHRGAVNHRVAVWVSDCAEGFE